jgi:alpha/beta hydrolase fold
MIPQFLVEVPDQSGRSDDRPLERGTLIPQHPRRQTQLVQKSFGRGLRPARNRASSGKECRAALRVALHKQDCEPMRLTRTVCPGALSPARVAAQSGAKVKVGQNQHIHGCLWKIASAVPGRANHQDPVTPPHLPGDKPDSRLPPGRKFKQRIDMGERAWSAAIRTPRRRSSMSTEQRENLDAILRQSSFPVDIDVNEQRRLLRELTSAQPLPADVTVTAAALGGVPTAEITVDGIEPRHVVLYFHGGVYVLGDAFTAADLASQIGRRAHAKVISVDYRLAPEHP